MKSDAIAFGVAGILFGLIAGWVIGAQQGGSRAGGPAQAAASRAAETPASSAAAPTAAVLDQAKVDAAKAIAEREPTNAAPRVQLGNMYFDAERYDEAGKWYAEAIKLNPKDVDVSTDLGVCYYYTNQPDKALEQFDRSLKLDPKHAKTLLNVGVVKAFGKQDLDGAVKAWEQVVQLAPESPEGQAAKRAIDTLKSAHPAPAAGQKPGV